jgi:hypothetical protein
MTGEEVFAAVVRLQFRQSTAETPPSSTRKNHLAHGMNRHLILSCPHPSGLDTAMYLSDPPADPFPSPTSNHQHSHSVMILLVVQ